MKDQLTLALMFSIGFARYRDRLAYIDYRKKKWAAGVIAISWVMHVKMAKIRKQLKITRKEQVEWMRDKTKVLFLLKVL